MNSLFKSMSYLLLVLICIFSFVKCEINYSTCDDLGYVFDDNDDILSKCYDKLYDKYFLCDDNTKKNPKELTTSSRYRELMEAGVAEACCFPICRDYANGKVRARPCKEVFIERIKKHSPSFTNKMVCKHYG